jgi:hypothetical protein
VRRRTGGNWTTWLPPALLDGTVRNGVTVPPPDGYLCASVCHRESA